MGESDFEFGSNNKLSLVEAKQKRVEAPSSKQISGSLEREKRKIQEKFSLKDYPTVPITTSSPNIPVGGSTAKKMKPVIPKINLNKVKGDFSSFKQL